ncbi:hypothetical protein OSTOST_23978 [Ostertagia ostertagi]
MFHLRSYLMNTLRLESNSAILLEFLGILYHLWIITIAIFTTSFSSSIRNSMAGGATRNARKSRKRKNSEDSTSAAPSRTLKQYSVDEKLEIIEFAKGNGNRAAGREYNVAESSIREWRKNEEKLRLVAVF